MKMQKYTAPDMRTALRKVRAAHGPEALILWTRRAAGVVELTVASDRDASVHAGNLTSPRQAAGGDSPARADIAAPVDTVGLPERPRTGSTVRMAEPGPAVIPVPGAAADGAIDGELKALRRLLETQLAALAWNDLTRRAPVTAELMREFAALGIARGIAAEILDGLPASPELAVARRHAHEALAGRIQALGDRWSEEGGVYTLVGGAGSGKTSALTAIAARWVLRNGPVGAALVSAGDTRFGAFEHLARLGRLLGLPTYQVDDLSGLPQLLARLHDQRLVLVDTAASGMRGDPEAEERDFAALKGLGTIAVALPATLQAAALQTLASRYARLGAGACIVTRVDEAVSLGGLLSAVIASGLPVAYLTEGTRLPDDLRPARADDLVERAAALVERHGLAADEDLLTRRLEGRVHAVS
jgi:flagellar biosynthesis protein FlhF